MNPDLSVNGPYSPVSLKKFLEADREKTSPFPSDKEAVGLKVLIDNTGLGIAFDDPDTLVMTPEDRTAQAAYYREHIFDGKCMPAYLFRYLRYMFISADEKDYPDDQTVLHAYVAGTLTAESDDYKQVLNLITFSHHNVEAAQVIGFIMLFAGTVREAARSNKSIRLFIQHPETSLHPQRAARWMSLFYKLQKEYGIRPLDEGAL